MHSVSLAVFLNLCLPVGTMNFGYSGPAWAVMSMPEATVDKKCELAPYPGDIRFTRDVSSVKSVSPLVYAL